MNNVPPIRVPDALSSSIDYGALNDDQRNSLLARIIHCREIGAAAENAALLQGSELSDCVDDIELDAFSVMSSSSDSSRSVSAYRIHSSWTFESDKDRLSANVDGAAWEFLRAESFLLESTEAALKAWLTHWASVMRKTLVRFEESSTYTEAVAQLIVLDALVAAVLVFTAAFRLRPASDT
ncbi:MAG TPA: hypothetical protein VGM84_10335 [Steroidobacteraceae bacterium]|jgi:hypothetical protein